MRVFTSMQDEDILATENSSRGVQALRGFLSFCRTGTILQTQETGREPDSDFEVAVISALDQAGFECVPQVGESGYYIDIAVRDPGKRSRYLMAIECDGATYHSAKSARDRDRLRQENLERLGWRVRRIWSTDWFKNPQETLKPIIDELNKLKSPILKNEASNEVPEQLIIDKEIPPEVNVGVIASNNSLDLRDKLSLLSEQVAVEMPATIKSARLLRPAMIEALVNHLPTTNEEFVQSIPSYLRSATNSTEGKYLEKVFKIINEELSNEA
jgi:very-short-patch-repair endonuclease